MFLRAINIEDEVSHFAPHVEQNETIYLLWKKLEIFKL